MRAPKHAYSYARLKRFRNTYARRPQQIPHMRSLITSQIDLVGTNPGARWMVPLGIHPNCIILFFTYVEHTRASLPELQYARSHPQSQTGVHLMRDGPKSYARRPHSTGGLEFAPKLLRMALRSHLPHHPNAIPIMRK